MTKEDFDELLDKTEQRKTFVANHVSQKIILTELEWVREYPFKTTRLDGMVPPVALGITDLYFGGQTVYAAKVKDKPYHILANKTRDTIGILITKEDVPKLLYPDLQKLAKKYKLKSTKKEDIIKELLTF